MTIEYEWTGRTNVGVSRTQNQDAVLPDGNDAGPTGIAAVADGLGGHPGLYAKELSRDFHLRGDTNGAREILFRHRQDTVRLNVPEPDICFDIDRPEDLEHALDPGARWARVEELVEEKKKPRLR